MKLSSYQEATMATTRNPIAVIKEAKKIARDHGCVVSERGGKFHVYRLTETRAVFLGTRSTPTALRAYVCKVTNFH
jgi:hypothetical protein